jgi:hypothetical protein
MPVKHRRDLFAVLVWPAGLLLAAAIMVLPMPTMTRCLTGSACVRHATPLWQIVVSVAFAFLPSAVRAWRAQQAAPR